MRASSKVFVLLLAACLGFAFGALHTRREL